MKTKRLLATSILGLAILFMASEVLATWYSATITLPRNGWWTTVERDSTRITQQTRVTQPSYNVVSNIANRNGVWLSSNRTHRANATTTHDHRTNVVGEKTKAGFRSSWANQRTNRVDLAWRP